MPDGFDLSGVNSIQRFLLNVAPRTKRGIKQITETTGRLLEAEMKANAAVDTGKMRQSIHYEPVMGGYGASISINVAYWAYIEFGTGGEVDVPPDWEEFAAQFKGSGKRTINIPAQPFVIPAYNKYKDVYYKKVKDLIDNVFKW